MKKNMNILALIVTFVILCTGILPGVLQVEAQAQETQTQEQVNTDATMDADIQLGVDGMSCPFCAFGIEKKISKLDAVKSLNVMLEKGFVEIFLKDGHQLAEPELREAVKKAGFTVRSVEYLNKQARPDQSG